MASRRTAPASYRAAQRAARSVERDLLRRVGGQLDAALERAVQDLTVRLASLPGGTPEARRLALERAIIVFRQQRDTLIQRMEQAAALGRRTSFRDVIAVWQEAARQAATAVGLPPGALTAALTPRTTMLAAYENVGGAKLFRTLLARAADDGYRAVNEAIRLGIVEGKSFEVLARELRPFVRGTFDTVRFNATRIAYSEIHNARAEAEVQHFTEDPLIEAVAWRLAPDRGTLRGPDACDALAENDFYGLGPGVYPVDAVPLPPHPFDRCERVPITRPLARANDPKPSPGRQSGKVEVPRGGQLSVAARQSVEQSTRAALTR
jgi:hypothetical protein